MVYFNCSKTNILIFYFEFKKLFFFIIIRNLIFNFNRHFFKIRYQVFKEILEVRLDTGALYPSTHHCALKCRI